MKQNYFTNRIKKGAIKMEHNFNKENLEIYNMYLESNKARNHETM